MAGVVYALAMVCGIVSLVCWIMVLVKIFQDSVGLGILGIICGLFTFIYGWVKVREYGIQRLMLVWTLAIVAGIVLQVLLVAVIGATIAGELGNIPT